MKFETINYIYNLLSKEVDTTETIQRYTYKDLLEADIANRQTAFTHRSCLHSITFL